MNNFTVHYIVLSKIENGKVVDKVLGSTIGTLRHLFSHAHIILSDWANDTFGRNHWRLRSDGSIIGSYVASDDGDTISIEPFDHVVH